MQWGDFSTIIERYLYRFKYLPCYSFTASYVSNPSVMTSKNDQIQTLIKLNDELENYFQNTIIPQLFVDANLILRKFTPPAMKQFKLSQTDVGKPIGDVKENFRFPAITENIQMVIETGEILEKEIQTTDMRWYQMNILPYVVKKKKRANGVIITFVDISPRIKDLKEQEKLNQEYQLLLDTIAHDIKNPLLALSLTVEMLKKLSDSNMDKFPLLLGHVDSSLVQMKKVISDLIDTRWQQHRYQPEEELLDLQNIVEDVRLTLSHQIQDSGAIIKQDIGISQLSFARRKLRSVLYNLISNAINYTPPERKPEIFISSFQEEDFFVISIADNGIGIAEADQEFIFKKFGRLYSNNEGSGVGLYLVKCIVDEAGGKITVSSEIGKGTVISIFIPIEKGIAG